MTGSPLPCRRGKHASFKDFKASLAPDPGTCVHDGRKFPEHPRFSYKTRVRIVRFVQNPTPPDRPQNHAPSFGADLTLANIDRRVTRRCPNNRAGKPHLPFPREHAISRFLRLRDLQQLAAVQASTLNRFNHEYSLSSRRIFKRNHTAALTEWRNLCMAYGPEPGHTYTARCDLPTYSKPTFRFWLSP
ncbi:hypothetical protein SAMN05444398_102317 [Roseovarius pacificus]|uniref:Uncharacterized protein n=1 Tax=Roseovarius pacificus TaxID=337701 RepID=A0A1M7AGY3_9RHOB|nr:hypothetical protein SAMN05444398_102317 [Roseovarius pacificus]